LDLSEGLLADKPKKKRKKQVYCVLLVLSHKEQKEEEERSNSNNSRSHWSELRKNIREVNAGMDGFLFYILVIKHKR
jgi:hypothetical protein